MAKTKAEIKKLGIEKNDFQLLDTYDKLYREHSLIAQMMRERILHMQYTILEKLDPESAEKFKYEFVRVEIDWERKMLLIIPTEDPEKKAAEVEHLIKKGSSDKN